MVKNTQSKNQSGSLRIGINYWMVS